jgi:hypothetical protein
MTSNTVDRKKYWIQFVFWTLVTLVSVVIIPHLFWLFIPFMGTAFVEAMDWM